MPDKQKTFFQIIIPCGTLSIILVVFVISVPMGYAHGVHIFARVEGDRILTESYFGDEREVRNGVIRVYDPSGKQLLEGKTDEKGIFTFTVPQETDLRIVLEASMGHRAEYVLVSDELTGRADPGRRKEKSPGLLEVGEGFGVILCLAALFYIGRKIKRRRLKKEIGK